MEERSVPRSVSTARVGGHVSLFNMIHHMVVLCRRSPEIIHLNVIPAGLRFAWKDGKISPLRGWEEDNLVQPSDLFGRHHR
jgi:hypothetical protein